MRGRGLSLLETVFASGLLAGVVFFLLNLYPASALAVRRTQDHMQADQIAQTIISQQQAMPFSKVVTPASQMDEVVYGNTHYKPVLEVFTVPGTDPNVLKRVRVTITWEWVRGTQTSVQEIYLAKLEN
jgi:hypothetical protein